mmetsp:Transcript_24447/g.56677  ORF Transcript_24447/g.56677 Transcript_24447/m.56677 type:complete len:200 (-) Transcript_24447:271-870(-)
MLLGVLQSSWWWRRHSNGSLWRIARLQGRQRCGYPRMKGSLRRRGASLARVAACSCARSGRRISAAAPFLLALCNLLFSLRVIYDHVPGLRPLGLQVPHMSASIWELHQSLGRRPKGFLGICLAQELDKAKASRFSGRLINHQMHSLDTTKLRKLPLDVRLRRLPGKVGNQQRLPATDRIADVCGHLLWRIMVHLRHVF